MNKTSLWIILMIAIVSVAFGSVWLGCASDDDGDSSDDNDDDDPSVGDKGSISGCVHDFATKSGVIGAKVTILNNDTGAETDISVTTKDTDGCVTIDGLGTDADFVGVKVTAEDNVDTLQYHFDNGIKDEEFLLVSDGTKTLIELALGVTMDPLYGHAAGSLYWGDPTDENPIGCQAVEFDPGNGDTHYFGLDGLPALYRDFPGDPTDTAADNGYGTNKDNGYFVSVNESPGMVTVSTTVNGTTKTNVIPNLPANSVAIANIYFSKEEFPADTYPTGLTPEWCTE